MPLLKNTEELDKELEVIQEEFTDKINAVCKKYFVTKHGVQVKGEYPFMSSRTENTFRIHFLYNMSDLIGGYLESNYNMDNEIENKEFGKDLVLEILALLNGKSYSSAKTTLEICIGKLQENSVVKINAVCVQKENL